MTVTFPLGARGARPVRFWCSSHLAWRVARSVPGTKQFGGGLDCTWDVAPIVARLIGQPEPEVPIHSNVSLPGLEKYKALFGDAPRKYQKVAGLFLARRAYAMLCDPMRVGKTLEFLIGDTLIDSERTLVICPAVATGVWAQEIAKWTKQEALTLKGLSCSLARQFCLTCMGRGRAPDGARCEACRARNGSTYGYRIFEVRETEPPSKRMGGTMWRCRKHPDVMSTPGEAARCTLCKEELSQAILNSRYIVVNYDLLTPRAARDAAGKVFNDPNMRGWMKLLSSVPFDNCGIDEIHTLRGFTTDSRKRDKMQSDRIRTMLKKVPRVWGITGTPIYGYVRDLLPQLNVISDGLYSGTDRRVWYKCFHERHCGGHRGEHGWVATGRTFEDELIERLQYLKIQRSRKELLPEMPQKQRRIEWVEVEGLKLPVRRNGSPRGSIMKLVTNVAKHKFPVVINNVLNEMAEGMKTYVLTYHRKTCERVGRLIEREMHKRQWSPRMRAQHAECWIAQSEAGINADMRRRMAEKFVDHGGAAVFVATMDSMPGSLSLKGAQYVHMVDFHYNPAAMEQAEDRPNELGLERGLCITHYAVKGSIDEHFVSHLIPKFEAKDKLLNDENAKEVLAVFDPREAEETIEAIWARHTAHLDEDEDDDV